MYPSYVVSEFSSFLFWHTALSTSRFASRSWLSFRYARPFLHLLRFLTCFGCFVGVVFCIRGCAGEQANVPE